MRSFFYFLVAFLLMGSAVQAQAKWATIVVEPDSGVILQAENERAPRYPASLTKIMTVYLALEWVKSGGLRLNSPLKISTEAARQQPTKLGLRRGRTITVEEAIQATIQRSANDAAVVLAEAMSGSERAFAIKMTAKARALGMKSTKFINATGLPGAGQVTTPHDMALLSRALIRNFPKYYRYFSERGFSYRKKRYGTINGWMTGYPGADGMKTGFTCAAGYNLVASATRDGQRLIAVIMGGTSPGARSGKASSLMNKAFKKVGKSGGLIPTSLGVLGGGPGRLLAGKPPIVLPAGKCARSGTRRSLLSKGPFPGWGILLGAYPTESRALAQVKKYRASLKGQINGSRPAVVAKTRQNAGTFSALLVGLSQQSAGAACKKIWEMGEYCLRLSPAALNNKTALWR